MKSILKLDKNKIFNIKFKKFKNFTKNSNVNKLSLSNVFISSFKEKLDLCRKLILLESLTGETFVVTKIKFYDDNKKHAQLGILIFLKIIIFKNKIVPCLSYFFIFQLFLYYEFFLKSKARNSTEFINYFSSKPVLNIKSIFIDFYFFMCWTDLTDFFVFQYFERFHEIYDNEDSELLNFVEHTSIGLNIFFNFNKIFFKTFSIIKKNFLKLFIFFFKKFFFLKILKASKLKKHKLFLSKKFLIYKTLVKA